MRTFLSSLYIIIVVFQGRILFAEERSIAVVKSQFDKVGEILNSYNIPYKLIGYKDLETADNLSPYKIIFFPCGMQPPIETSINILSYGTSIKNVSLKKDYCDYNHDLIAKHVRDFVSSGGIAYFSGYSYSLVQCMYKDFEFFNGFPYLGMNGEIKVKAKRDLKCFISGDNLKIRMHHSGWIAIKSVTNAKVMAESTYSTPMGEKTGPLIAFFERGDGEAYYTSYHYSDPRDPVMRYILTRIITKELRSLAIKKINEWEQKPGTVISDMIMPLEWSRSYELPLVKGKNTIYFESMDNGFFQMDVYDQNNGIIVSHQTWENSYHYTFAVPDTRNYKLRIFPLTRKKRVAYVFAAGHGPMLIKYWRKILLISFIILFIIIVIRTRFLLGPRKYSGRRRLIT